jgi:hypothetical protein
MTTTNCRDRRDAIFLLAAGALESGEEHDVALHLATGCSRCGGALAEAREALSLLPQSLDPVALPAGARARLLARATGGVRAPRIGSRRLALRGAGIAASIGLVIGAGGTSLAAWWYAVAPLRAELADLRSELDEQDRDLALLEADARLARQALQLLRADDVEAMALVAVEAAPSASGRVFWERRDYGCYFHAEGLAAPAEGRTYVLWVVSAGGSTFAAAKFVPDASGEASFVTRLPRDLAPIARALVTEEPVAHGGAPGGAVQLEAGGG